MNGVAGGPLSEHRLSASMTLAEAKLIIADVNPSLFVVEYEAGTGRDHVLSIKSGEQVGTTNYDLRALEPDMLRAIAKAA